MSALQRWRLVLGKYAEKSLGEGGCLGGNAARMDAALDWLYRREHRGRGVREEDRAGSLDRASPGLVDWLGEVRELFPRDVVEIVEKHALHRYGLTELLTDPQALQRLEPNQDLLRALLALRGHVHGETLAVVRRVVARVVEDIRRRLEPQVRQALAGRLHRHRHSPLAVARNFDAVGTVRRNLAHWDPERKRLVLEKLLFFDRNARRLPWDVILCVDQSGSMADSVIHSAVMAGILAGLPSLRVRLVVFSTEVVDLTDHASDPVETLLRVQLGGGTDIGQAVRYCSQLVENPHRTVLVLVTDFCEGASPGALVKAVRSLAEARVRLIGLASLDSQAEPVHDRAMASRLAECGMEIAALTPQRLAEWLVRVIS